MRSCIALAGAVSESPVTSVVALNMSKSFFWILNGREYEEGGLHWSPYIDVSVPRLELRNGKAITDTI
jgi:hypothetical protein